MENEEVVLELAFLCLQPIAKSYLLRKWSNPATSKIGFVSVSESVSRV